MQVFVCFFGLRDIATDWYSVYSRFKCSQANPLCVVSCQVLVDGRRRKMLGRLLITPATGDGNITVVPIPVNPGILTTPSSPGRVIETYPVICVENIYTFNFMTMCV